MAAPYFSASTLDDLLRYVLEGISQRGCRICPTKGPARELNGVLLELANPRARVSRTETRGKPFSCLGELFWYLSGTNELRFIRYYIPYYKAFADGDHIYGGYGPRLFDWRNTNQLATVTALLKRKRQSRQAIVQLFDAHDLTEPRKDVPCTCTLQFMIRNDRLHLITNMRSNDVHLGVPHDIFCFTMLQEIVARRLDVDIGTYKHMVGSLHLYDKNVADAQRFLSEGWQPTQITMPPMPPGDPWPAIRRVLAAERAIRTGASTTCPTDGLEHLDDLDPYWADLVRLLLVFRAKKAKNSDRVSLLKKSMASEVYVPFIQSVLDRVTAK